MSRYEIEVTTRDGIPEYRIYERVFLFGFIPIGFKEVLYTQNVDELNRELKYIVEDESKK